MLYHRGWNRAVEVAGASLRASLLTRRVTAATDCDSADDDVDHDGSYVVNLDPRVVELLHDARHLQQMSLDVSDAALALCHQQPRITGVRDASVL